MLGSSQPSNTQRLIELRQRKLPRREQGVSLTAVERAEIQGSAPWEQTEASEDPCGEERERWRDGDGEGEREEGKAMAWRPGSLCFLGCWTSDGELR